jgi:hypothetical protein
LSGNNDAILPGVGLPNGQQYNPDGGPSADIDVETQLHVGVSSSPGGSQVLSINGEIRGDKFPSAEAFVKDAKGTAVFLGVSPAGYGPTTGPFLALPGNNRLPMMNVSVQIVTNSKGLFTGVMENGKVISIDSWNAKFKNQNPK